MFSDDIVHLDPALDPQADNRTARSWRPHTLNSKLPTSRIHLSRKNCKLSSIPTIFEQHQIVRVQTHGSSVLVFVKQVLSEVQHTNVAVV